jgi:hypothetical protein
MPLQPATVYEDDTHPHQQYVMHATAAAAGGGCRLLMSPCMPPCLGTCHCLASGTCLGRHPLQCVAATGTLWSSAPRLFSELTY